MLTNFELNNVNESKFTKHKLSIALLGKYRFSFTGENSSIYLFYKSSLCPKNKSANELIISNLSVNMSKYMSNFSNLLNLQYFYLSDHLGSSSWITDKDGNALQHLSYLPFGEVFANQKASGSSFDAEFKFLGKELDSETGYTKTDNRYYWAEAGVFLSVDPLAEARAWISQYNYSQNNPVGRKDPTGRLDDKYFDEKGNYLGDDGKGNNIRIITKNQFAMFTDNGNVSPVEIESELKMIGVLFSDYVQKTEMSSENQLKVYDYFNPTDLSIENSKDVANMGFSYNTAGNNLKLLVNLKGNSNYVDNYDNVRNIFEHEKTHYCDFRKNGVDNYRKMSRIKKEQNAINTQMRHKSWKNTSQDFKDGVIRYGKRIGIN